MREQTTHIVAEVSLIISACACSTRHCLLYYLQIIVEGLANLNNQFDKIRIPACKKKEMLASMTRNKNLFVEENSHFIFLNFKCYQYTQRTKYYSSYLNLQNCVTLFSVFKIRIIFDLLIIENK
jgi:hypothetical protein